MSETETTTVTETGEPNTPDPNAASQELGAQNESVDSLPEWARAAITKANNDAARYRTEKNDAVNAAKALLEPEYEAKLTGAQEAHEETKSQLAAKTVELLKLTTALDLEIPSKSAVKFAALLSGTTEDEIRSHAEEAKALFGGVSTSDRPTDRSQGSGNTTPLPLNGDPLLDAVKRVVGAR
ncbi:hypothetical protein GS454_01380 [Rhodococcus hoagii]|nr:hypothetical protein [Prescottella equi]